MPPSMRAISSTRSAALKRLDGGAGDLAVAQLRDAELAMRLGRDLRQMRHAQHLRAFAERAQLPADDFGDRAADARRRLRRTPCTATEVLAAAAT